MKLSTIFTRRLLLGLTIGSALAAFSGCGGSREMSDADKERLKYCTPIEAAKTFDETPFTGGTAVILSFQNIRAQLNSACANCHRSPAISDGFSYLDQWGGSEILENGHSIWRPGFSEAAERMRDAIFSNDPKKQMPPEDYRKKNPEAFLEMGRQLDIWIQAGKPNGSFRLGETPEPRRGKLRLPKPHETSELGDCVPKVTAVGSEYKMDRLFEAAKTLPKYLSDTDLHTLDPLALARTGTFAYNVEYPLWADNADKGRWVHVPMKLIDGKVQKQSIRYNESTKEFDIPENTRFYKNFYRGITLPNGRTRMRRMETRLIVSRPSIKKADGTIEHQALFGTYQWDETEQIAVLVEAPYRDGTPWKDLVFDVSVDEIKGKMRPYAIPGRTRCIDCHKGSPTQNFVLGFQPLQINKRPWGAAGREDVPAAHDLDQVARFLDYGLVSGIKSASDLPVLENMGSLPASNVHELRANGYMVGNCYHCHNPKGFAYESGVQLALGPGDIFQFNTQRKSSQMPARRFVHQNGELDGSHIWRKVADSAIQQGMFSQMPMHTPGQPDCRVLTVMGKWIRSFESVDAAEAWAPECKKENPFFWIDLDFTWPSSDVYTPRRNDWKDPSNGMPVRYREMSLSKELSDAIKVEYPVGYWLKKPTCQFPVVDLPVEKQRPWMLKDGQPKRPFGEVYSTTPGSYFFRNTCVKCHGPKADGVSSLATGILNWSGGSVRVANLMGGLFGNKNENLKTFDLDGKNYGGNYMIWMAMEGTRVRFPPELSSAMGKHGGQMLNGIRDKCLAQISSDKPSSTLFMDHEIFNKVCFMENLRPGHPDLAFDPNTNKPKYPDKVEQWLDHGAWNAGWAIFEFLREASSDKWRPANDQCDVVFPKNE